jgi:putative secretion ATPase (PEP-CTERM system associated)
VYEPFYGLTAKPFQLNPDPTFYYGSKEHRRAMAYLEYGLHKGEGFIVVTGEIGAGKTTVVRNLLNTIDTQKVVAAHLVTSQLDADDTLRMVAAAFGLHVADVSKSEVLLSIEAYLLTLSLQGKRGLLILDEAQNLTLRAMEELRMLSNYQLDTHALLQTFLVGQPEFRRMLESPQMQQLRQRVVAGCHISSLDTQETREYIEHRLVRAGWTGDPQFEDAAYESIFRLTSGIPRKINSICDRLLLSGYLAENHVFTSANVEEACREIQAETSTPPAASTAAEAQSNGASSEHAPSSFNTETAEIDFSALHLDADAAKRLSALAAGLQVSDFHERLERLERTNAATAGILRDLLGALRAHSLRL